ncbi:ABC transporter permease [bacterium]|nr:MAG: ABC transporter permease [bacterium]
MINVADAFVLASTKLRTRKVRTVVTAITASLLFGILIGAIFIISGILNGAERFTNSGLSNRYIVSYDDFNSGQYKDTAQLQARATELYNARITAKKAEAKRLGIEFDQTSEMRPVATNTDGNKYIDETSPSAQQAIDEQRAEIKSVKEKATQAAGPYRPIGIYSFLPNSNPGVITAMEEGRESFKPKPQNSQQQYTRPGIENGWAYLDEKVVEPFLLDKKLLSDQKNITDVPVIAPIGKVEMALGLLALPKDASAKEKLDRIAYVRQNAAKATFTVCYRNEASAALIAKTFRDEDEMKKNAANKEYIAPSQQYALPNESSCGASILKKDTRTADEKKYAAKQDEFAKKFNEYQAPDQQKITFRVVGVGPDGIDFNSFSTVDSIVGTIAGSTLQGQWVVPNTLFQQMPNRADFDKFYPIPGKKSTNIMTIGLTSRSSEGQLIEFGSAKDVKAFYVENSCSSFDCMNKASVSYFGSNSVVIDDMKKSLTQVLQIAAGVMAAIAALVMMGMVGRVIADGRRETAVFRAIGATRNDLRLVYTIYTLLFSLIIICISVMIGFGMALFVESTYASDISTSMHLAFITAPLEESFHLIGFWPEMLAMAAGLIILAGLVSMQVPLMRNLARNPIKDMRDE